MVNAETRTLLTGGRCMEVERLTDRLNTPDEGTGADGLKLALTLPWKRRGECPSAEPVLVCHDEVVIECDANQAEDKDIRAWLEMMMIEGMDVSPQRHGRGGRTGRGRSSDS